MARKLKLSMELIPVASWGKSLRLALGKTARWNKIRKSVLDSRSHKCEICGSSEKIHCHEHWKFDKRSKVQTLVGLGAICNMCHFAVHFGRAKQVATQGYLDLDAVISHFMEVNQCDRKFFDEHHNAALSLFMERSGVKWDIDYGEYANAVQEYEREKAERAAKKARK